MNSNPPNAGFSPRIRSVHGFPGSNPCTASNPWVLRDFAQADFPQEFEASMDSRASIRVRFESMGSQGFSSGRLIRRCFRWIMARGRDTSRVPALISRHLIPWPFIPLPPIPLPKIQAAAHGVAPQSRTQAAFARTIAGVEGSASAGWQWNRWQRNGEPNMSSNPWYRRQRSKRRERRPTPLRSLRCLLFKLSGSHLHP